MTVAGSLALARDCYKLYVSIDDSLRRIANQAFLNKFYLSDEVTIDGEPGEPFNVFFNPNVQTIRARTKGKPLIVGLKPAMSLV